MVGAAFDWSHQVFPRGKIEQQWPVQLISITDEMVPFSLTCPKTPACRHGELPFGNGENYPFSTHGVVFF